MIGQPKISSIYRHGHPEPDSDPLTTYARIEALRRKAWRERKVVAVSLRELPEPLRTALSEWAEANYG